MLELLLHVVVEQTELELINIGIELLSYPFQVCPNEKRTGDVVA